MLLEAPLLSSWGISILTMKNQAKNPGHFTNCLRRPLKKPPDLTRLQGNLSLSWDGDRGTPWENSAFLHPNPVVSSFWLNQFSSAFEAEDGKKTFFTMSCSAGLSAPWVAWYVGPSICSYLNVWGSASFLRKMPLGFWKKRYKMCPESSGVQGKECHQQ